MILTPSEKDSFRKGKNTPDSRPLFRRGLGVLEAKQVTKVTHSQFVQDGRNLLSIQNKIYKNVTIGNFEHTKKSVSLRTTLCIAAIKFARFPGLTLVLLNPDTPCLCKQCRSTSQKHAYIMLTPLNPTFI